MSVLNGTAQEHEEKKRIWTPKRFVEAQTPIMRALGAAVEGAFPNPGAIIKALNQNGEELAEGLRELLDSIIPLGKPSTDLFENSNNEYEFTADDTEFSGKIQLARLELVPALREGETEISGEVLRERARGFANFGQHHGQFLADNWWDLPLPSSFKEVRELNIALPGTIFQRRSDGFVFMSKLWFTGRLIILTTQYIGHDERYRFGSDWFFLRLKKR